MKRTSFVAIIMLAVLTLCLQNVKATVTYNDGETHHIGEYIPNNAYVYDSPSGSPTTVIFDSGAYIYDGLDVHDNSQVFTSARIGNRLRAFDDSQVTMTGGQIGNNMVAFGSSQITMLDGVIGQCLSSDGSSQFTLSGGHVYGNTVNIGLEVRGDSQFNFSGGIVDEKLTAFDDGTLTIYGSDFMVDGQPVGNVELTSILGGSWGDEAPRHLQGTLLNGDSLANDFYIGNNATIVLIPEPTTLLLLGMGGLTLQLRRKPIKTENAQ